jgi:hypothetical protein
MKENLHIQCSPTRLKQIEKIAFSGSRAKFKILNGKLEEGFQLLKSTTQKFKSFATDLADRIPQPLAARVSLDLFAHFESKSSKKLGIPKGVVLGGVLALMASLPAVGQIVVTNTTDENDNAPPISLRDAIFMANTDGGNSTILLPNGSSHLLTLGDLPTITNDGTLQIICTGSSNAIIDGATNFRPFTTSSNADLHLSKLTIQNGSALRGGGVYNYSANLTISSSTITNNKAFYGAGLFNKGGDVLISSSTITLNSASQHGGGIYSTGNGVAASLIIQNSTINLNSATNHGGGIFNRDNNILTISSSSISHNTCNNRGGGISNYTSSPLTITNSTISNNTSTQRGGGMQNGFSCTVLISSSTISGNTSTNSAGGAIASSQLCPLTILNSTISGNTSNSSAGAVYLHGSTLSIFSSSFSSNTTTAGAARGGAVSVIESDVIIQASTFNNNQTATQGGAMFIQASGGKSALIQNTTISGNNAGNGGGIYHDNTAGVNGITLNHVTLSDNTTKGFVNSGASNITIQNTIIANTVTGADFTLVGAAPTSHINTGTIVEDGSLVDAGNVFNVDPLLGALTLNSGFLIHPVKTTSQAINAGTNLGIATDQVGNVRDATPHLGAVEVTIPGVCMVITAPAGVTNTWIGCTNSDWNTASNWSTGAVPTASDVVYVPIVAASQLVIDEVATCGKMLVQIGAKCLVNYNAGGKLVVEF